MSRFAPLRRLKRPVTPLASAALLCCLILSAACDRPASNVGVEVDEPAADAPKKGNVSLPSAPSAEDFVIKEKNADGTLRVQGLIEYKDKYKEQEVSLSGLIPRLSPMCDPKKAKKEGTKCMEPHMVIRDDEEGAEKLLLVVGYDDDFLKRAKLEEGTTHRFQGTYQMFGRGFTASEDGLLVLSQIDDVPVTKEK